MPKEIKELEGATYPAAIWKQYMTEIHRGLKPLNFLPYAKLSEEFLGQYYPEEEETVEDETLEEMAVGDEPLPLENTQENSLDEMQN